MKTLTTFLLAFLCINLSHAQLIRDVDYVSPFYEGLAAIQQGDAWGFIDEQGNIVIDYRHDLVLTATDKNGIKMYPRFYNGRCPIFSESDNIRLYGYIDTTGKEVITPQFLAPIQFSEDQLAIVQKLNKDIYGTNDILQKDLVRYTYNEILINGAGKVLSYLNGPTHIIPYKDKLKVAPKMMSILLSANLVATKTNEEKWIIQEVTNQNN